MVMYVVGISLIIEGDMMMTIFFDKSMVKFYNDLVSIYYDAEKLQNYLDKEFEEIKRYVHEGLKLDGNLTRKYGLSVADKEWRKFAPCDVDLEAIIRIFENRIIHLNIK